MEGWIKLHRKLLSSSLFNTSDAHLLQLFIYLLLSVNHEDRKLILNNEEVIIKKGQGVFGIKSIVFALTKCKKQKSKLFTKNESLYYRKLKTLENINIIKIKSTNKYSVVTILNWEQYQSSEDQVKIKRRSSEDQMKTNKNEKNDKNNSNKLEYTSETIPLKTKKERDIEIDYVLETYEKKLGFKPTDRKPRQVAYVFKRQIIKFIADLKVARPELTFSSVVDMSFKWYTDREETKGETIDVVRRKVTSILFDRTRKKYLEGGETT